MYYALWRETKGRLPLFLAELDSARGAHAALDRAIDGLKDELVNDEDMVIRARGLTEQMAVTWQAALLVKCGNTAVSDAFIASRLGPRWSGTYGTLPTGTDFEQILQRIMPE